MRKLKLDVETLAVESFAPAPGDADGRGTVQGFWSQRGTCDLAATCQAGGTCAYGCGSATCDPARCY